jgi:NhaP-type Na+/H+ or K+/H+ antiporter
MNTFDTAAILIALAAKDLLLACTYSVVVFSVLVQGPTVRRVLVFYGIGEQPVRRARA